MTVQRPKERAESLSPCALCREARHTGITKQEVGEGSYVVEMVEAVKRLLREENCLGMGPVNNIEKERARLFERIADGTMLMLGSFYIPGDGDRMDKLDHAVRLFGGALKDLDAVGTMSEESKRSLRSFLRRLKCEATKQIDLIVEKRAGEAPVAAARRQRLPLTPSQYLRNQIWNLRARSLGYMLLGGLEFGLAGASFLFGALDGSVREVSNTVSGLLAGTGVHAIFHAVKELHKVKVLASILRGGGLDRQKLLAHSL